MLRPCLRTTLLMALATVGFGSSRATGQDMVLVQMFGSGVHSYFAGDYQSAMSDLSSAIDAGSTDPRAYYFRGLAEMRMGKNAEAQADFDRGADLEAKAIDRFYPVSRSLERVQGIDRVTLEKHRAKARAVAYQEKQKREQARYERLRRAEESVLRAAPVVVAPPAAKAPAAPAPPAEEQPAPPADDPFGTPAEDADKPVEKKPEPPAEEDPFAADDAKPAPPTPPAAADEDPFADEPAKSDEKKPEEPKAAEDENPFGN